MEIIYQKSVKGAKVKFIIGLAIVVSFFNISMLKEHQLLNYQIALVIFVTTSGFIFDYLVLTKLFKLFELEKTQFSSIDCSINSALRKILKWPLLFKILKVELLTLYYAFFAKFEKKETTNETTTFSYSKLSNAKDMFWIVAIAQLPTLPFIHAIIENKNEPMLAWVVTLLTLWSVICYLAQVQAIRFRPIELDNKLLKYRSGLSWKSDIPLKKIIKARKITYKDKVDGFAYFLSPLGSEKNIIIEFDTSIKFFGPLCFSKSRKKAAISLDKPEQFLNQLSLRGIEIA
ncbi:MAG: hypothetical protein COA86_18685 [Kangiella sp.]|nr:MAG: hypothetical protein COA86_18685 [Kangiella sp.]